MEDMQLLDGLVGALVGALIGVVPAVLAWRASLRANRHAQRSAEAAEHANSIADEALEEARRARKIQYDGWHREAKPHVTILLEDHRSAAGGGYPMQFSCDRDIDSGSISLVDGWDRRVLQGLGANPDEEVFSEAVTLPALRAGAYATLGLWIVDIEEAEGKNVRLRFEVAIGDDTWSDVRTVELPRSPWDKF
jgi:hypothetical protein